MARAGNGISHQPHGQPEGMKMCFRTKDKGTVNALALITYPVPAKG